MRRVRQLSASLERFHEHGWMRLPRAFSDDAAAAMREVVWQGLARHAAAPNAGTAPRFLLSRGRDERPVGLAGAVTGH